MSATATQPVLRIVAPFGAALLTRQDGLTGYRILARIGGTLDQLPYSVIPCDATYYGDECEVTGTHVWHSVKYANGTSVQWEGESLLPRADYACVICGEPEGSDYARPCCENNVEMV